MVLEFPPGSTAWITFHVYLLRSQGTAAAQMVPQGPELSLWEPCDAGTAPRAAQAGGEIAGKIVGRQMRKTAHVVVLLLTGSKATIQC